MNKQQSPVERRQFGRRWNQVQGWISIDGRPRIPCTVQNMSEGGAQVVVDQPAGLPAHFHLVVDALKMRLFCEKVRDLDGIMGVRFLTEVEYGEAVLAALSPPSTYELLLREASAEREQAERAQELENSPITRLALSA